ncbi:RES domain-containing protein [uncultured Tenacibaculum sp.]|uniref:RES domain-containing protein n=1 Tax=uncultured Tenacibaculum sp. TaxID=174713 RepID=UPI0026382981|nr:RES domain-containing protein [uncultured Tenacibaculum sp.]
MTKDLLTLEERSKMYKALDKGYNKVLEDNQIREILNFNQKGLAAVRAQLLSGFKFYRARFIDENIEKYDNISELLAVPKEYVSNYGRCNKIGESVFYAANNYETMYSEMRAIKGDRFQVIELELKEGCEIWVHAVGFIDSCRRHGEAPSILGTENAKYVNEIKNSVSKEQFTKILLHDAFIANWFRKRILDKKDYNLTSMYSEICLKNNDGIFYPSVGHQGGWNLALNPSKVIDNFKINKISTNTVTENFNYGLYNSKMNRWADNYDSRNGNINWNKEKNA